MNATEQRTITIPWSATKPPPVSSSMPAGFEFAKLTAGEQSAAVASLQAAADDFAGALDTNDPRAEAARRLVALHSHRLAVGADGVAVLLVEHPVIVGAHPITLDEHARKWFYPPDHLGLSAWRGCSSLAELYDVLWSDGELRPLALPEAIAVLVSPSSPEAALARRRADLATKKKEAADAAAAATAAEQALVAAAAAFQRENARRIAAWDALPREVQALHVVAEQLPVFRPLLAALAAINTPGWNRKVAQLSLPATFLPDLKG